MKPARVVSLLITSSMCMILWTETSGHHLCSLCEKTRSGEACRGKMRQLTPDLVRYLGTRPDSWACNMHRKRAKREANRFCACPLPVHCKELNTHNIPERLVPVFDRIGGSIPGYRRGLRWCNRCCETADQHFQNEPDYIPPKRVHGFLYSLLHGKNHIW